MGLNIYGYVNNSGIGTHTKYFTSALSNYYPDITLVPCDWNLDMSEEESKVLAPLVRNIDTIDLDDPYIIFNMPHYMLYGSGKPRIGYPVFETSKLKPSQMNVMKQMDYMFVTSKWAKDIVIKNMSEALVSDVATLQDTIFVVPEGVDTTVFNPQVTRHKFYDDAKFTFMSVGKFEMRKSPKEVLDAFTKAFDNNKDVRLVTHWWTGLLHNWVQLADQMIRELGYNRVEDTRANIAIQEQPQYLKYQLPNGCEIVLNLKRFPDKKELAKFYRCADVGVYASRGEGWNLPLIESMACGMPCVVGNWTAHTEFVDESVAFTLSKKNAMEVIANDEWFFKGDVGTWHEPNVEDLSSKMKEAYEDSDKRASVSNAAWARAQEFSWDNAGSIASSILYDIFDKEQE